MRNFQKIFASLQGAAVKNCSNKIYMPAKMMMHYHRNTYLVKFKRDIQLMKALKSKFKIRLQNIVYI